MWFRLTLFIGILLLALSIASWRAVRHIERQAPPVGEFFGFDGGRLHVLELGKACKGQSPSVVLVHGASVNLRDMAIALGERLAQDRHVVLVDRPGAGYSDRRPKGAYSLKTQARLINQALAELGVDRPLLVGQSLGGALALAYTLEYQESLSGLMVLAPVSHEWPGGVAWHNHVAQTPIAGFAFRHLLMPLYGVMAGEKSVANGFAPDHAPEGYFKRAGAGLLFRPHTFKYNAEDLVGLKPQIIDQQEQYGQLKLPMTIITGDVDTTVSPTIHSTQLAKDAPHARFIKLPGVGHALHHAASDLIIAEIESLSPKQAQEALVGKGDETMTCS